MPFLKDYLYNIVTAKAKGPLSVFLRALLLLLSFFYGFAVIILSAFHRMKPYRFQAKVISIGNITLGGTGKTTLVEYVASLLKIQNRNISVLTRGYKNADEPAMLQKKLSFLHVIVDPDRIRAGQEAVKYFLADTLLLDDGFQQWKIFKDLEIVTIDAKSPFGNNRLVPAGFLREPLASLKRANIFILTQVDQVADVINITDKLKRINPRAMIFESIHKPENFSDVAGPGRIFNLDAYKGKSAVLFSGIGNPEGFENCIRNLGIKISESLRFADHQDYTQKEIENILDASQRLNCEVIITTQKDAIKLAGLDLKGLKPVALNIKLKIIKNEEEFNSRLLSLFSL